LYILLIDSIFNGIMECEKSDKYIVIFVLKDFKGEFLEKLNNKLLDKCKANRFLGRLEINFGFFDENNKYKPLSSFTL